MSFLLDTNVVSEWVKPQPHRGVNAWLVEVDEDAVFLSVVTLAELRRGVERLPGGRRKERLEVWLRHELPLRFTGRLLGIDDEIADVWGRLVARSEASGRAMTPMDGFIAATAVVHGLTLVTRNVTDFRGVLPKIVNPWSPADHLTWKRLAGHRAVPDTDLYWRTSSDRRGRVGGVTDWPPWVSPIRRLGW